VKTVCRGFRLCVCVIVIFMCDGSVLGKDKLQVI
jgi:hypothetical protein